ncbi:hypothetical protein T07_11776 [Trichinella nelsoni]|uniref:Uncharacterized protein n=1 Tax=Trichinella nelsoni TaxID=6336 RepID=A0A0V0RX24_9BILA|nr:hypothetical protein T07_11776 [Trichinella nelsoni]
MFGHDLIDTAANWSGHGKCHTVAKVHPWTREIKIRSTIASGGMATLDNGKAEEKNAVLLQRSRAPLKNRSCRESLLLQAYNGFAVRCAMSALDEPPLFAVGALVASETVLVSKYCATGELREQRITLSLDHFSLITELNLACAELAVSFSGCRRFQTKSQMSRLCSSVARLQLISAITTAFCSIYFSLPRAGQSNSFDHYAIAVVNTLFHLLIEDTRQEEKIQLSLLV